MNNQIKCPNCGAIIDVNEILYHELENKFKNEYQQKLQNINKEIEEKTKQKLIQEKEKLKQELFNEQNEMVEILKKELQEKSKQVIELNKSKAEIEKLKIEKEELESKILANAQKEMHIKLQEEKQKLKAQIENENELKLKEKEEQLKQLQIQLKIAQQKATQGSMQLQGEVQELAIEEYLKSNFPFDTIEEIKKGAKGGDCIQYINTREAQNCGKIYYESKRAKEFQKAWIEKFKTDMREKGIDIGVIVTSTYPKELKRMGIIDGVWICSFEEFKGLSIALRESLIKLYFAKKQNENKTDKMSLLYNYLTSNEFKMEIEAIVEAFSSMQNDLEKEKRAMQKLWKQREKQIQKVLESTINMYGSIKGIAGSAIKTIELLELDEE